MTNIHLGEADISALARAEEAVAGALAPHVVPLAVELRQKPRLVHSHYLLVDLVRPLTHALHTQTLAQNTNTILPN